MNNFWSKALGVPAAPAQTSAPVATQTQSLPWWQQSLPPSMTPQVVQQPQSHAVPVPTKAISAQSTESCPMCQSDHYFKPLGMANAMTQCYSCGYNPRFDQQAYAAKSGAPTTATRQNDSSSMAGGGFQVVAHV